MATYVRANGIKVVVPSHPCVGDFCAVHKKDGGIEYTTITELTDSAVKFNECCGVSSVGFKICTPEQLVNQTYIKLEDLYNTLYKYGSKKVYFAFDYEKETSIISRNIKFKLVLDQPVIPYYVKRIKHDSVVLTSDENLRGIFVDMEFSEVELNRMLSNPENGVKLVVDKHLKMKGEQL